MKTLSVSLIALLGLAMPAVAAPLVPSAPPSALSRPATVLVGQTGAPHEGKIAEVIAAGAYTYLLVTQDGTKTWLAIPRREIAVGTRIEYGEGALMTDFHSSSLDRTFAEVWFLDSVVAPGDAGPGSPSHPPIPDSAGGDQAGTAMPPGHPAVAAAIDPADLPHGGTVAEVISAGNYTYLRVDESGAATWLAIPRQDIPVGARVRYDEGAEMKDFHSAALNRDFASVLFLGGVAVLGE